MKKIILLSASIACVFAASAAQANCLKPASGYNFTLGLGYKGLQGNQRVYTYATPTDFKDQMKLSSSTAAGVASLGFGQQGVFSPNGYLGVEVNANVGKVRSNVKTTGPYLGIVEGYFSSFENKYTIGGAVRLGLVHNATLWFLSVGGSSGRFNFTYTDVAGATLTNNKFKKHLSAVTCGFGAQTHFKKMLLKAEVGFANHKSFKHRTFKPVNAASAGVSFKMTPRTSIASVSVGYAW